MSLALLLVGSAHASSLAAVGCVLAPVPVPAKATTPQTSNATLTLSQGMFSNPTMIEIHQGSAAGAIIGKTCSSALDRGPAKVAVTLNPAITTPAGFVCAAIPISGRCTPTHATPAPAPAHTTH